MNVSTGVCTSPQHAKHRLSHGFRRSSQQCCRAQFRTQRRPAPAACYSRGIEQRPQASSSSNSGSDFGLDRTSSGAPRAITLPTFMTMNGCISRRSHPSRGDTAVAQLREGTPVSGSQGLRPPAIRRRLIYLALPEISEAAEERRSPRILCNAGARAATAPSAAFPIAGLPATCAASIEITYRSGQDFRLRC